MERLSVDRLRADEKLIELVKGYPCLWATQSKSFRDLAAKESAWKIVSAEVGYTDEDCIKRWKALRDRFVREAKKVKENMTPEGTPAYVPPWSLFEHLAFLMDSIRHRKPKRDSTAAFSEETELDQSGVVGGVVVGDGEFLSAGSPASSVDLNASPSHQSKRRKSSRLNIPYIVAPTSSSPATTDGRQTTDTTSKQVNQAILKSLKTIEETVQEHQKVIEDEDELFGKQVAMVMRRLDSKQKATAKLRIQQVFLDIEFPPDREQDISS